MVKGGKGCNIGVKGFGIAEVKNPRDHHSSLNEDLDASLRGLRSLIVLDLCSPSSFGADTFDVRSFRVDDHVIAPWTGGWAYKKSAIVVKVPVRVGDESPEVVDIVVMVIGDFEKDW
jgi:hypothetical protein